MWPDLCRGNTEKRHTQAKKESLSSETWSWNMNHIGISIFQKELQFKQQSSALKSSLSYCYKILNAFLVLDYSCLIPWLLNICRAVAAPPTSSSYIQQLSSRCQLIIVKYENPLSHNYPQLPTRTLLLWTDIKFYLLLVANCPKISLQRLEIQVSMQQENTQDHVFSSGPNVSSYVRAALLGDQRHPGQVLLAVQQAPNTLFVTCCQ